MYQEEPGLGSSRDRTRLRLTFALLLAQVFKNSEIPLTEKLEALYHKYLFQLAISMAKAEGMDEAELSDIYLRYGDHLYSKGDFDGAMVQYIRTLGYVQPSHVIRKVSLSAYSI